MRWPGAGRAPTRPSVRQSAWPFRVGNVVALPAGAQPGTDTGVAASGRWWLPGCQASIHAPLSRVRAAADEVAQVEGGGAVLEPGVVSGGAEVAESPGFSQARRIM